MKKVACLWLLPLVPGLAQQPKFEIADVHPSTTLRAYVQSFGGVVREGLYINREATMLDLVKAAYGVSDDDIAGGPGWVSYDLFDIVARLPEGTTPQRRTSCCSRCFRNASASSFDAIPVPCRATL